MSNVLSVAAMTLQRQNQVVVTPTILPTTPKIFTIGPVRDNVCCSLTEEKGLGVEVSHFWPWLCHSKSLSP